MKKKFSLSQIKKFKHKQKHTLINTSEIHHSPFATRDTQTKSHPLKDHNLAKHYRNVNEVTN